MVKTIEKMLFLLLFSNLLTNISVAKNIILSDPDEMHADPTVLRATYGVTVKGGEIFSFGSLIEDYVKSPFDPEAKTREKRFGKYIDSQRLKFPKTKYPGEWRGVLADKDGRRIIWDASMLQMVDFYEKDLRIVQETTVPVDLIKPPADRMGQPTQIEIKKAREHFKRSFKKVFGPRYTGLSELPKGWINPNKKVHYAVSTKIDEFPIMVLSCEEEDKLNCMMSTYCFLEGGPKISSENITGVAVQKDAKILLVGNSANNTIQVYKWESCFNLQYVQSLTLPKAMQKLTSISVDDSNRLWVTTNKWENKYDSNLYYWDQSSWLQL